MKIDDSKQLYEFFETTGVGVTWYSGRGMFGKECLGITGSWPAVQQALSMAIVQAHREFLDEHFQPFVEALLEFSWDNMGHDVVLYFRQIPRPDEEAGS